MEVFYGILVGSSAEIVFQTIITLTLATYILFGKSGRPQLYLYTMLAQYMYVHVHIYIISNSKSTKMSFFARCAVHLVVQVQLLLLLNACLSLIQLVKVFNSGVSISIALPVIIAVIGVAAVHMVQPVLVSLCIYFYMVIFYGCCVP